MGLHWNTIGIIFFLTLFCFFMFVYPILRIIYFVTNRHKSKQFYKTINAWRYNTDPWIYNSIDQILYIVLAIAATCLLIELFMLEANVYE